MIFSDELNHASLIDGCRLSRARVIRFRHRDPEHLASQLREHRAAAPAAIVITESVFSLHGLGFIAVSSVTNMDLPVIVAMVMIVSAFIVLANLIVDIAYGFIDPRVKLVA